MTPRLNWTWAGGQFFAAASIRFYCWQRCACSSNPTRDNSTTNLWLWLNNHQMTLRSDGSLVDETGSSPGGFSHPATSNSMEILPPQEGQTPSSGQCGSDGKQFCPQAWNTSYFGSLPPRTPPNASDIETVPGNRNLTICGNRCKGPQDCSPTGVQADCNCAYPFPDDAVSLGFDPVFPVAVCLVLVNLAASGKVSPRNTPKYVNSRGETYRCLCNATYVAPECCGSKDGMIYLD